MKTYSETRRVDDLGRIALPKGVRQFMKIREGDPLDISVVEEDDGRKHIRLDYHSEIKNGLGANAQAVANTISSTLSGCSVAILDRNLSVIAMGGQVFSLNIDGEVEACLLRAKNNRAASAAVIDRNFVITAVPLVHDGEVIAIVAAESKSILGEYRFEALKAMANVICAMI